MSRYSYKNIHAVSLTAPFSPNSVVSRAQVATFLYRALDQAEKPVDPVEPIEPVDPEPTEPVEPTEPPAEAA